VGRDFYHYLRGNVGFLCAIPCLEVKVVKAVSPDEDTMLVYGESAVVRGGKARFTSLATFRPALFHAASMLDLPGRNMARPELIGSPYNHKQYS